MSFSICARVGEAYAVAVAGHVLAVGTLGAAARPGLGAVCVLSSRATTREALLERLAAGADARQALDEVIAAAPDEARRSQIALVGRHKAAVHTGDQTGAERGERVGGDESSAFAITGHLLTCEAVLDAIEHTFVESTHLPVVERVVAALAAGDIAGGDRRGRQSASVLAVEAGRGIDGSGLLADLRVDDHESPVAELARLARLADLHYGPVRSVLPLQGELAAEVTERLARLGLDTADVDSALEQWARPANLWRRLVPGSIDARVLQALREATVTRHSDVNDAFPTAP